ncbi:MAG: hypothetical protein WAK61_01255 [Leclercia sp.]
MSDLKRIIMAVSSYKNSKFAVEESFNRVFSYKDSGCYVCTVGGKLSETSIMDRVASEIQTLNSNINECNQRFNELESIIDDVQMLNYISHATNNYEHQESMRFYSDEARKITEEIRTMYLGTHAIQKSNKRKWF